MFAVATFDSNKEADNVCKELFSKKILFSKKKERVQRGKVAKKKKQKTAVRNEKIKGEYKEILINNGGSATKIKKKKKKHKKPGSGEGKAEISPEKQTKRDTSRETQIDQQNKNIGQPINNKKEKESISLQGKKKNKLKVTQETQIEKQKKKKKKRNKNVQLMDNKEKKESTSIQGGKNKNKITQETKTLNDNTFDSPRNYQENKKENLRRKLQQVLTSPALPRKKPASNLTLRQRMMQKLQAARFRFLNEQIYSSDSKEAQKIFKQDPEAFKAYHEGYRLQVEKWPLNPVDVIIKSLLNLPKSHVIADFGCGDAKIAQSVPQKVHSFDLVACNDHVVACDMAHVPIENDTVDIVVFCLSLMGTNLHEYLLEANRVLKTGGILKVAEVESRFEDVNQFIEALKRFNFKNTWQDLSHNLFYFLDFKKDANVKSKKKLPTLSLQPCLYKKR